MNAETLIITILIKMPGIRNCQRNFITHIMLLYLRLRGRYNFENMSRYGSHSEKTYRINFFKQFDWKAFNRELIQEKCSRELIWIFDPSYVTKSGKHTPGVGYFRTRCRHRRRSGSGCAGAVKWGLEIAGLAVGDVVNHTAMHYQAQQTHLPKEGESLLKHYARQLTSQASELKELSKIVVVDAYFSKKEFVDSLSSAGLILVSRMRKGVYLRYQFKGEPKTGRGAKKKYGGKIDVKNLSQQHFTLFKEEQDSRYYEGIAHIRSLQSWCKVVINPVLKAGEISKVLVYFSTDPTPTGAQVLQYYRLRYQIEYVYRDSKQFTGLTHCQSRQEEALAFHFNLSLTALNIAKATHSLSIAQLERPPFSRADVKCLYFNEMMLDRIISLCGKDPLIEKNNPLMAQLYKLGTIAA